MYTCFNFKKVYFFKVSTLHLCCISLDRYFAFDYHHYMTITTIT